MVRGIVKMVPTTIYHISHPNPIFPYSSSYRYLLLYVLLYTCICAAAGSLLYILYVLCSLYTLYILYTLYLLDISYGSCSSQKLSSLSAVC